MPDEKPRRKPFPGELDDLREMALSGQIELAPGNEVSREKPFPKPKFLREPILTSSHLVTLAEHGIHPPENTAWTPELVERFVRLSEASDEGRLEEA